MLPDPIRITLLVTQVLEKIGIRYLIGGSLASTIYGRVRTTQDADIVADMHIEGIRPFIDGLKDDFYLDENMIFEAIQHNSSFNIIHRASLFKVDVFIPSTSPFTLAQLERAQKQIITHEPDSAAYFASPEDTILAKLVWFRMGGETSERQWQDVIGIFQVSSDGLDYEYLRKWGKELNIIDLVEKAIIKNELD